MKRTRSMFRVWIRLTPFASAGIVLLDTGVVAFALEDVVLSLTAFLASSLAFYCGLLFARSRDF